MGPNRVKPTWPSTGSTPVRVDVWYQMKWQDGSPGTDNQLASSGTLTGDPPADFVVTWETPSDASFGGILQVNNVYQIEYTQV